jgi:hypothetical protein
MAQKPYRMAAMRCVLVNNANLKSDTCCSYCSKKIGDSYAREIGSRLIYCDYDCYRQAIAAPMMLRDARAIFTNARTFKS